MAGNGNPTSLANMLPPDVAAVKHGSYPWLRAHLSPPCAKCPWGLQKTCPRYKTDASDRCSIIAEVRDSVFLAVMEQDHIRPEDEPLAALYAKWLVAEVLTDRFIAEATTAKAAQTYVKLKSLITGKLLSLADALGLTPKSRKALLDKTATIRLVRGNLTVEEVGAEDAD